MLYICSGDSASGGGVVGFGGVVEFYFIDLTGAKIARRLKDGVVFG